MEKKVTDFREVTTPLIRAMTAFGRSMNLTAAQVRTLGKDMELVGMTPNQRNRLKIRRLLKA
ncbi:hypothetical protein [Spirosoma luteum]|uniref:hypothetical protein n=1 Tax=Spirosoma luteum TaxID=431553 RepID=UPI000364BBE9|nr:hypothetical protein [Spirosoma luteum]